MSHWPSEIREFKDEKTGRTIKQLTATGNNVHLYFTENSFDLHRNEIYFLSDRASGADKAPHEDPAYSLFRMNLDTGEIERLSDDVLHGAGTATKTPDSALVAYQTADSTGQTDRYADGQDHDVVRRCTGLRDRQRAIDRRQPPLCGLLPQRDHRRARSTTGARITPGSKNAST